MCSNYFRTNRIVLSQCYALVSLNFGSPKFSKASEAHTSLTRVSIFPVYLSSLVSSSTKSMLNGHFIIAETELIRKDW